MKQRKETYRKERHKKTRTQRKRSLTRTNSKAAALTFGVERMHSQTEV
jgi:hypothetical protein